MASDFGRSSACGMMITLKDALCNNLHSIQWFIKLLQISSIYQRSSSLLATNKIHPHLQGRDTKLEWLRIPFFRGPWWMKQNTYIQMQCKWPSISPALGESLSGAVAGTCGSWIFSLPHTLLVLPVTTATPLHYSETKLQSRMHANEAHKS